MRIALLLALALPCSANTATWVSISAVLASTNFPQVRTNVTLLAKILKRHSVCIATTAKPCKRTKKAPAVKLGPRIGDRLLSPLSSGETD